MELLDSKQVIHFTRTLENILVYMKWWFWHSYYPILKHGYNGGANFGIVITRIFVFCT